MRRAVASLSPVSITTSIPSSCNEVTAAAAVGRAASAMPMTAAARPSTATATAVRPPFASSSRRAARPARSMPSRSKRRRLPTTTRWPSTVATAPCPGTFSKSDAGRPFDAVLVGVANDGLGEGMLGLALDRRDEAQQLAFVDPVDEQVGDLGFALGEGAGLVHDDRVDAGGGLDAGGVLEQHAALGAETGADHDRGGRGQAERVGAGDDDDRDGEQHRLRSGSPADSHPRRKRQAAAEEGDEHEPERGPVGEPLTGRLGVLRLLDELHDLRERRVGADLGRPHPKGPVLVDRRADHGVARLLVHRQALAGDHRLVDVAVALLDDRRRRAPWRRAERAAGRRRGLRRSAPRPVRRRGARPPSAARGRAACGWHRWRRPAPASRTSDPSSTNEVSTATAS